MKMMVIIKDISSFHCNGFNTKRWRGREKLEFSLSAGGAQSSTIHGTAELLI